MEEAVNNLSGFLNTENSTWVLRGANLVTLDLNLWKRHEISNLYEAATLLGKGNTWMILGTTLDIFLTIMKGEANCNKSILCMIKLPDD